MDFNSFELDILKMFGGLTDPQQAAGRVFGGRDTIDLDISNIYYKDSQKRIRQDMDTSRALIANVLQKITGQIVEMNDQKWNELLNSAIRAVDYRKTESGTERSGGVSEYGAAKASQVDKAISKIQGALQRTANQMYAQYVNQTLDGMQYMSDMTEDKMREIAHIPGTKKLIAQKQRELAGKASAFRGLIRQFSSIPSNIIESFTTSLEGGLQSAYAALEGLQVDAKKISNIQNTIKRYGLGKDQKRLQTAIAVELTPKK